MAIIVRGRSECALCADVIAPDHDVFATTAFLDDPNHAPIIRFEGVSKHFGTFRVLNAIDFAVAKGERVVVWNGLDASALGL